MNEAAGSRVSTGADDDALLELVQRRTFAYFWDYAHPFSAMARDRGPVAEGESNDLIAVGGSAFGVMAIIIAAARGWITRAAAVERLTHMLAFLKTVERHHGIFPHFLNGATGEEIEMWRDDAGGDTVESSYLFMGLLCARQYFDADAAGERELRDTIGKLWQEADWNWYTAGIEALHWHWHPEYEWGARLKIEGWNEALITYVLAASSPGHAIDPAAYHGGWVGGGCFRNGKDYYGVTLPLGPDFGGPVFFAQLGFSGLDPRVLTDRYADYWQQNLNHTLVNYEHCLRNPKGFRGYGPDCWGLTACDGDEGYAAFAPDNDRGVIAPSAALSSFPYTPVQSMRALRYFHAYEGGRLWGKYGLLDAFNATTGWVADQHIAVNQGPLICMIENHRTGLLWRLFMSCPEVRGGLARLGFQRTPGAMGRGDGC
jgi:hypothetical protein